MKRTVRKSTRAELDFIDVWEHTLSQWHATHADRYLDELEHGIGALVDNPELGVSRESVRSGYRALFIKSHVVYYIIRTDGIFIVRVLHERMDPKQHL